MRQFGTVLTPPVVERPGAYAVIVDAQWRVAVVQLPDGVYLPGGGIEPEESPHEALRREVLEETGLQVEIVSSMGIARQFVRWRGTNYNKIGQYFVCRPVSQGTPTESDHTLCWWPSNKVLRSLTHESQRWMVRRALSSC